MTRWAAPLPSPVGAPGRPPIPLGRHLSPCPPPRATATPSGARTACSSTRCPRGTTSTTRAGTTWRRRSTAKCCSTPCSRSRPPATTRSPSGAWASAFGQWGGGALGINGLFERRMLLHGTAGGGRGPRSGAHPGAGRRRRTGAPEPGAPSARPGPAAMPPSCAQVGPRGRPRAPPRPRLGPLPRGGGGVKGGGSRCGCSEAGGRSHARTVDCGRLSGSRVLLNLRPPPRASGVWAAVRVLAVHAAPYYWLAPPCGGTGHLNAGGWVLPHGMCRVSVTCMSCPPCLDLRLSFVLVCQSVCC